MIRITNKGTRGKGIYVGRPSPLGNPYPTKPSKYSSKVYSLEDSLRLFAKHLEEKLISSEKFKELLETYERTGYLELDCWCCNKVVEGPVSPEEARCHAELIASKVLELARRKELKNFVEGDLCLHLHKADTVFFTANSVIKRNGELVMGRGFALELKERFPFLPALLGREVRKLGSRYGTAVVEDERLPCRIGAFQVKDHFKNPASPELIKLAFEKLLKYAEGRGEVFMNFPGIGYGGMEEKEVLPLIPELPENVRLWKYKKEEGTRIALVGGRSVEDRGFVEDFLLEVLEKESVEEDKVIIVSGGAKGVDRIAREIAKDYGFRLSEYLPDWERYGKRAGMLRNDRIIREADLLIAVPSRESRGTWDSVRKAKEKGIPVYVKLYEPSLEREHTEEGPTLQR